MATQAQMNEHVRVSVDARTELENRRQAIVTEAADKLVALAKDDLNWQMHNRGVSREPALREVGELIDMAVDRLRYTAHDGLRHLFD